MNAKENRSIKAISFSHDDDFENELYAFATDPARGKFSHYVKRLIDRDRASLAQPAVNTTPAPIVVDAVTAQPAAKVGKTIAKSFL